MMNYDPRMMASLIGGPPMGPDMGGSAVPPPMPMPRPPGAPDRIGAPNKAAALAGGGPDSMARPSPGGPPPPVISDIPAVSPPTGGPPLTPGIDGPPPSTPVPPAGGPMTPEMAAMPGGDMAAMGKGGPQSPQFMNALAQLLQNNPQGQAMNQLAMPTNPAFAW